MSRWNNDLVFYRVFCVTLLATAFIFTLILTNVFIDIDGLLSNKEKAVAYGSKVSVAVSKEKGKEKDASIDDNNEFYNEDSYEGDDIPAYRTKRSTETENILLYVKNPLMKKLITRRLANLLEELDKEDPKQKEELQPEATKVKEINEKSKTPERVGKEDLLHLAMHNILLQGLIGHMDLNDIYKKVHKLFRNFNDNAPVYNEGKILEAGVESKETSEKSVNADKRHSNDEEHNFLNEIIKCKQLKKQVSQNKEYNNNNRTILTQPKTDKPQKVIIKTIIEINEENNLKNSSLKDIEGLIRVMYNGKPIKFNRLTDEPSKLEKRQNNRDVEEVTVSNNFNTTEVTEKLPMASKTQIKNPLNMVIEEYLTKHPFLNYLEDGAEMKTFQAKRLKRQIKIRYFNSNKTSTFKSKQLHNKTKKPEEDLYIEIETHFDGKGVEGEKKKKLVKNLIEKIQKALHSDNEQPDNKERIKFIKRVQDPIDFKEHSIFINKILPTYEPIEERQLDPIGKTLDDHENVINRFGEKWKKQVVGPSFLTVSKSVNSAEMRELNINYDVVSRNGIPKRFQKPLNTEFEEDTTTLTNVGNVSLFLKDIDGTGFSIGINQYAGEPPDKDSLRIFSGLENLIKEYHKTYDQEDVSNESNIDRVVNFVEKDHKLGKRSVDYKQDDLKDIISTTDSKVHSNTYNLSYKYNTFHKYANLYKHIKNNDVINRKKRSINVKKISNLNSKIKLNRYINTNPMANKKIFLKNKRNKRQVHNIRIIARDRSVTSPKYSDENIFLISRENAYSDRASIVGEMDEPETVIDKKNEDMFDEVLPFGDFYKMQIPEAQSIFSDKEYDTKVRPSLIMSRYPHIFMDDITNTKNENSNNYHLKERNIPDKKQYRIKHVPKQSKTINRIGSSTVNSLMVSENEQKDNDFLNSILPPKSKSKYKVTVKVSPKNISTNAGFKEVHTSVNKSYDQNGLRYFSVLNVSQISKIEKLNKTETEFNLKHDEANNDQYNNHLKKQQQQMNALLRLHKKRVDQQLGNLIRESKHLERMMGDSSRMNINKTISILSDVGEGVDKLRDEKINKILDSVKKLEETYKTVLTTTLRTTTTQSTTLIPIETDNIQLIDTIRLNEKVTYEILKKIDSNTNILKTFLQKLKIGDNVFNKQTTEKTFGEVKLDMTKDWKSYKVSNLFFNGNESKNNTVPFVYAYQQPIPINSKTQPIASLMYHGHIHTNAVRDKNHDKLKKTGDNNTGENNSTFYIKEIDGFNTKPGPFISDNIKINTTSA